MRRALQAAVWAAERFLDETKRSLNVVRAGFYAARALVRTAQRTLDAANAALNGIRRAYRAGIQALTAIARIGLGGLISIREIYFRASLRAANGGAFTARIKVSFLGRHPVTLHLHINVRHLGSTVKQLASHVIPGIGMMTEWKSLPQLK